LIVINNDKLLQQYSQMYRINSYFSDWKKIKKELVKYKKGEIIALYGEDSDKLFFLLKGTIRFTSITDDYEEYFFFDATNEGLFGEVEYVLNIPSITQSEVIDDCQCIVIPISKNRYLLDHDLKFQKFVSKVLAKKYNDMRFIAMNTETYSLDVRLIKYLLSDSSVEIINNITNISKTLKCSYRQLLRVLKDFCSKGWIKHLPQKGKYRIINRKAMQQAINNGSNANEFKEDIYHEKV